MKEPTKPTCFIIMPISTPEHCVPAYGGDVDHFSHVLHHLFIPAVEKAGFKPVPPLAQGAELIHGEIVKNLEIADLVLCDMSILNPNVFFELGIRTALNRPVCLVRDDKSEKVPFDATIINHHIYKSNIAPWLLPDEINALAKHAEASKTSHGEKNALWSYFSMSQIAKPGEEAKGNDQKMDFMMQQLESIRRGLAETSAARAGSGRWVQDDYLVVSDRILELAAQVGIPRQNILFSLVEGKLTVNLDQSTDPNLSAFLERWCRTYGIELRLYRLTEPVAKRE